MPGCEHQRVKAGVTEDYCGDCGQPPVYVLMENPCKIFVSRKRGEGGTLNNSHQQPVEERKQDADGEQADQPIIIEERGDTPDDHPEPDADFQV